jgi:membrane-associated phospholipid phosphatase
MVIINRLNLPGEIHQVQIQLDQAIPLVLLFVPAYLLYFPFVYGGWAVIFFLSPRMFRPYAFAMMTIGLITGIVNITYNTYAARAFVEPTDFLARTLIWLYSLNQPMTALPSLHVSHSLCTGFFLSKIYPKLTVVWVSSVVLITLSTLFIKTHYFIDVVISVVLGIAVSLVVWVAWDKRVTTRKLVGDY